MIKKYKPRILEAIQFDGTYECYIEIKSFAGDAIIHSYQAEKSPNGKRCFYFNYMKVIEGYYIVKKGDNFFVEKADIFEQQFEEVAE